MSFGRAMTSQEWYSSETYQKQADLKKAMVSRPLTIDELQAVGNLGYRLLVNPNEAYTKSEKQAEFAALLAIQQSIQLAASRPYVKPSDA